MRDLRPLPALLLLIAALAASPARAQWATTGSVFGPLAPATTGQTYLLDIRQGSALSRQVSQASAQGFELSGGAPVRFDRWYGSAWKDLQLSWMTQWHPQWGLIWGWSTGERGAKYRIDPSVQLGFVFQQPLGRDSSWSLRATTRLGGRLRESACVADYGDIGGVQAVNCRLAASVLPPAQTLRLLWNDPPHDRVSWRLRFVHAF